MIRQTLRRHLKSKNKPLIVGITGSMGMGKSTLVKLLKQQGPYPIFDADQEIKKLYLTHGVCQKLAIIRPNLIKNSTLQRPNLIDFILEEPAHLQQLEAILYPELAKIRQKFLQKCRFLQMKLVFLDIPLLIEKQMQGLCDYIIVVHCPPSLQQKRLGTRKQYQELQAALGQQQIPSSAKIKYADFVIQTGLSRNHTVRQLQTILRKIDTA